MATVHDGTGSAWSETDPQDGDPKLDGAQEIRDLRTGLRKRLEYEHTTPASSTAGGKHKQGSAKAYQQASAPTQQPDGSTALGASDAGRVWIDDTGLLKWWDGSQFSDIIVGVAETVQDNSIQTNDIVDDAVTAAKLNSDTAGAGLTQNGTSGALEANPDNTTLEIATDVLQIKDGALSADAAGRAKMANGFLTAAKLAAGSGIGQWSVGTYTGDGGTANQVTGVGFKPDLVLIHHQTTHQVMMAIRNEASGSPEVSDIMAFWNSSGLGSSFQDALQYDSDGFTILKATANFNANGDVYTYVALKMT